METNISRENENHFALDSQIFALCSILRVMRVLRISNVIFSGIRADYFRIQQETRD